MSVGLMAHLRDFQLPQEPFTLVGFWWICVIYRMKLLVKKESYCFGKYNIFLGFLLEFS